VRAGAIVQVSGGSIKPLMSTQEFATVAHEVTLDDTKARRELGYAPTMTIERGMAELRSRR
jgi:nucleoside-diphosphate-sugar epimerase